MCEEVSFVSEIHKDLDLTKDEKIDKEGVVLISAPKQVKITSIKIPKQKTNISRLVATRRMYDEGVLTSHSSAFKGLAYGGQVKVNPLDMEKLGINPNQRSV